MKNTNNIKRILFHYGNEHQKRKAMEELQELRDAIALELLELDTREHVLEEIADVLVMIEQLKLIYHITDTETQEVIDFKIKRQLKRIGNEKISSDYSR